MGVQFWGQPHIQRGNKVQQVRQVCSTCFQKELNSFLNAQTRRNVTLARLIINKTPNYQQNDDIHCAAGKEEQSSERLHPVSSHHTPSGSFPGSSALPPPPSRLPEVLQISCRRKRAGGKRSRLGGGRSADPATVHSVPCLTGLPFPAKSRGEQEGSSLKAKSEPRRWRS